MSGESSETGPRSRGSVIAELLCLTGFALLTLFWIIPSQVSGGGLGLDPGFLPRLCAAAMGILVVADGLHRLRRTPLPKAYPTDWSALIRIGICALVGAVVLQVAGVAAAALIVVPAGMLALGERRPVLIAATTIVTAGALKLFEL